MTLSAENIYSVDELTIWHTSLDYLCAGKTITVQSPSFTSRPNPAVMGDLVIASIFSPGQIVAFDRSTGTIRWQLDPGYFGSSHVYPADSVLYVWTARSLFRIRPDTGDIIWEYTPYGCRGECFYGSPTCAGNRVFIGDHRGWFHCVDAQTGQVLWKVQASPGRMGGVNSTPLVQNGIVMIVTLACWLIAYDVETGKEVWRTQLDGASLREVFPFKGAVLTPTEESLYLVSSSDGTILHRWHWKGCRIDVLTTSGNQIYVGITDISVQNAIVSDPDGKETSINILRDEKVPHNRIATTLLCLDRDITLWKLMYPGLPNLHVRWDTASSLLYETSWNGLGIIASQTGRRCAMIRPMTCSDCEDTYAQFSPPSTDGDVLFVLCNVMNTGASLLALRHP